MILRLFETTHHGMIYDEQINGRLKHIVLLYNLNNFAIVLTLFVGVTRVEYINESSKPIMLV